MSLREMASYGLFNTVSTMTGVDISDIVDSIKGLGITDKISERYNDFKEKRNKDNNTKENDNDTDTVIPNVENTYTINNNGSIDNDNAVNSDIIPTYSVDNNGSFVFDDIKENEKEDKDYSSKLKSNVAHYQQIRDSLNTEDLENLDIMRNYMISINTDLDTMLKGLNDINANKYAPLSELVDKLEELEKINEDILDLNKDVSKKEVEQFFKLQKEISDILDDNEKEFKNDEEYLRYLRQFKEYTGKDLHNFADFQERFEDYAEDNNANARDLAEWSKKNYEILSSVPAFEEMKNITGQLGLGGDLGALMEAFGLDPFDLLGKVFNRDKKDNDENLENLDNKEFDDFSVFDDMNTDVSNIDTNVEDLNNDLDNNLNTNVEDLNNDLNNSNKELDINESDILDKEIEQLDKEFNELLDSIPTNDDTELQDLNNNILELNNDLTNPNEIVKRQKITNKLSEKIKSNENDLKDLQKEELETALKNLDYFNNIDKVLSEISNDINNIIDDNFSKSIIEEKFYNDVIDEIKLIRENLDKDLLKANAILADIEENTKEALDNDIFNSALQAITSKFLMSNSMSGLPFPNTNTNTNTRGGKGKGFLGKAGKFLKGAGGKLLGAAGTAIGVGATAYNNFTDPNLSTADAIKKTAIQGGATTAGAVIGGALGSLIPIPGVGTFLGATLGGWAGEKIGNLLSNKVLGDENIQAENIDTVPSYQNEDVYDFNQVDTNNLKYDDNYNKENIKNNNTNPNININANSNSTNGYNNIPSSNIETEDLILSVLAKG